MKILKKINIFRRKLTKLLTKNIGNTQINENYDLVNKEDIKRIGFSLNNIFIIFVL